jgi:MFS family permease
MFLPFRLQQKLVASFSIFGAAFIMRPFGGMLFGWVGDKFGRLKSALSSPSPHNHFATTVCTSLDGALSRCSHQTKANPHTLTHPRRSLMWSVGIMSFATLLTGSLPSYGDAGISAIIFLVIARLIQGYVGCAIASTACPRPAPIVVCTTHDMTSAAVVVTSSHWCTGCAAQVE